MFHTICSSGQCSHEEEGPRQLIHSGGVDSEAHVLVDAALTLCESYRHTAYYYED